MKLDYYKEIRKEIRTLIVYLETKFTQVKIAALLSKETAVCFYAKDINLLKVLDNNRWSGKAKVDKLETCLKGLKAIWKQYEDLENSSAERRISTSEKHKLHQLIKNALAAEFLVYKNVPKVDEPLNALQNYFCVDSKAYESIIKTCQRVKSRMWSIQQPLNPSYCDLLDFKIVKVRDNRVFIQTTEYWFLKWFSFKLNKYNYIYENTNDQLYIVEKINDDWKIVSNIYSSPNTTAPPTGQYINHYINNETISTNLEQEILSDH